MSTVVLPDLVEEVDEDEEEEDNHLTCPWCYPPGSDYYVSLCGEAIDDHITPGPIPEGSLCEECCREKISHFFTCKTRHG